MKKMPRKFSQGGEMQPKEQPKSAEAKKPEAKKPVDNMPDWAKRDLKEKEQDWKTKQGAERKALTGYKKGGSIKKFAEGGKFSSDVYENARKQIRDKYGAESKTETLDELVAKSPKEKTEAPKAKSSAAPKTTPKKSEPDAKPAQPAAASSSAKDNESDSDLSVEPRRYLPRGRNYSATGEMSPQGAELVKEAGITAATLAPFGLIPRALQAASAPFKLSRKLHEAKAAKRAEEAAKRRAPKDADEMRFADEGNPNFKRGGKVAKYAKGGGVESKGKTKGTVVKMAKGGSVKGWGISRGAKACKMV